MIDSATGPARLLDGTIVWASCSPAGHRRVGALQLMHASSRPMVSADMWRGVGRRDTSRASAAQARVGRTVMCVEQAVSRLSNRTLEAGPTGREEGNPASGSVWHRRP